ncbi:SGNH/GDSL hydrolase family protein [Mycetocola sp. JXN-3]|uniref:SGNH/GDSL hydrolase family protein n=1 Tax=Mycetocola sp. JXN-3 TaxID=2116510 RepID=UPI00165CF506|nr:SGNH/GDSL hydrolase family protein [Mycetocola sp. JXN-3]
MLSDFDAAKPSRRASADSHPADRDGDPGLIVSLDAHPGRRRSKPSRAVRRNRAIFALLAGMIPVALIALLAIPGDDGVLGFVGTDAHNLELSVAGAFEAKSAASASTNPKVYVLGDSYSRSSGASDPQHDNMHLLAAHYGWTVDNLSEGGVGYGTSIEGDSSQSECGQDRCASYLEQIASIPASAQRILVNGGKNEVNVDETDSDSHIDTFFAMLRAAHPTADIVATSPIWQNTDEPDSMVAMRSRVQHDVQTIGGHYLDIGQPLVSAPDLLYEDGEHPNDAGHVAVADAMIAGFTRLGDKAWTSAKGTPAATATARP